MSCWRAVSTRRLPSAHKGDTVSESPTTTRRPLRGVTLDFWHTLFTEDPASNGRRTQLRLEIIGRLLHAQGYVCTDSELEAAHAATGTAHVALHARGLDMTFAAQVQHFLEQLRLGLTESLDAPARAAIAEAYAAAGLAIPPVPTTPNLKTIMLALRERGLCVGLISNTGRTPGTVLRAILGEAGILEFFDHLTFSDEVELTKPNPAIFARTLAALDVDAGESAHVGDDPVLDVFGARQAAMAAIQVGAPQATAGTTPTDRERVAPDRRIATLDELPEALDALAPANVWRV